MVQSDPLKETMDGVLPRVEEGAEALGTVPTSVPQSIEEVRRRPDLRRICPSCIRGPRRGALLRPCCLC